MINEYIKGLFLIFAAEMGDKTQILAMTFATQYTIKEVLYGVFAGSFLNHAVAVLIGYFLSTILPIDRVQIFAGIIFIIFALWNLREDDEEDEESKKFLSPIITVAIAFFIGELGDKTQLAAITLAADSTAPLFTLMGTVSGMVITSLFGILIGIKIGKNIPEFTIKIGSSIIFFIFGTYKLYNVLPGKFLNTISIVSFFLTISIITYIILKPQIVARKQGYVSKYKKVSIDLYNYKKGVNESVSKICLTEDICAYCKGKECIINNLKEMLESEKIISFDGKIEEKFKIKDLKYSLIKVLVFLNHSDKKTKDYQLYNNIRKKLEMILFNKTYEFENAESYFKKLKKDDHPNIKELIKMYENEMKDI